MEQILQVLAEVTQPYRDTRSHYCRLEVVVLDGDRCALAGVVLDGDTLRGVIAGLSERLPGVDFDVSRVRILRAGATQAVVATNLTGLYAASSFLAEQVSQLLNGWPVEILMEDGRWRFVRLADRYLGWAYGPYLAETAAPVPSHIVCPPVSLLRARHRLRPRPGQPDPGRHGGRGRGAGRLGAGHTGRRSHGAAAAGAGWLGAHR